MELTEKTALQEKTFALLEYGQILECVASRAMSCEAAAMIMSETPLSDPEAIAAMKEFVQAILLQMRAGSAEPRESLPETGALLGKLDVEGAVLQLDEAWALGVFIERGEGVCRWLSPPQNAPPLNELSPLAAFLEQLPDCGGAAKEIFRVVDKDGSLRDLPELRPVKQRIRTLNSALEDAVSRYAASAESRKMLQSPLPSLRDGRTVLAVKANFRGRIRGIVHEVSASGQTVFVEPEDVVALNNELLIEQRNLAAITQRILRELTARLSQHAASLQRFHRMILHLERLRAKARYAYDTNGCFAQTSSAVNSDTNNAITNNNTSNSDTNNSGGIIIKQARHPLISGAVPIDLAMDSGFRTLIISGPNTGGKTVTLKTTGLFALMNQSGIALPAAEGTVLPVFDGVYAGIGDEQSISRSLSTFSGDMRRAAGIISCATEHSLILLDELGSATGPDEGCALAMAILDCLAEKKSRVLITTHHGILKNYGWSRQGARNASVEFDPHTLSPTYRIISGLPGESHALDIALASGLPDQVVEKARDYLSGGHSDLSALIRGLKEKQRELDAAEQKIREEEIRLREERRSADLKALTLRQKELELKTGAAGKLSGLLDESRKTLENLVREVREGEMSREKSLKVKAFLKSLERASEEEAAALEDEARAIEKERNRIEAGSAGSEKAAFAPGMEVFIGGRRRRGRIIRHDKKNAAENCWIVETGAVKISFPEKDLFPAAPEKNAHEPLFAAVDFVPAQAAGFEIDLRGMRLPEALETLRRQIDAALMSGLKRFAVVHGKGDGILQNGIHEYLRGEPAAADFCFSLPEAGGSGRTEVTLK